MPDTQHPDMRKPPFDQSEPPVDEDGTANLSAWHEHLMRRLAALERENHSLRLWTGDAAAISEHVGVISLVLDSLTAHIAILDEHGTIRFVNHAWRAFACANQAADACEGANYLAVSEQAHGPDAEVAGEISQTIREMLNGRRSPYRGEYPCHSPDRQRWFSVTVTRLESGGAPRVVVVHEDITARKLAELEQGQLRLELERSLHERTAALERSEHLLRGFFEHSPAGLVIFDAAEPVRYRVVNPAMADLLGMRVDQIVGKTLAEVLSDPQMAEDHEAMMRRAINERRAFLQETSGRLHHGELVCHQTHCFPLLEADGEVAAAGCVVLDLTQRKQTERTLQLLSRAMHQSSEGLALADNRGTVTFANPAFARMHGYEPAEVLGQHLSIFHTPDQMVTVNAINERVVATGEYVGEVWHARRDGSAFPARMHNTLMQDDEGRPLGIIATMRDVTDQKAAEERLHAQTQLMRYIIHYDPNAIAVLDGDLRYVFVSERFLHDYGLGSRDIIGKHHYEVFPEIPARWREIHQRVLNGAVERAEEDWFARLDGTREHIRWHCRPWYRNDGTVGGLVMYTEVITKRKQAERALRLSEQRLRAIIDEAPVGIVVYAPDGTIRRDNTAARTMLGLDEDEYSRFRSSHNILTDSQLEEIGITSYVRRAFQGETVLYPPTLYRVPCAVGRERRHIWLEGVMYPILDEAGGLQEVVVMHRDVTEGRRAEEESRDLQEQLQHAQKLEAIGQLAGGVAHDFNNLLTVILGNAARLESPNASANESREAREAIEHAAEQASGVTRALLTFSHKIPTEKRATDLRAIVTGTVKLLRRLIPKSIELDVDIASGPALIIRADPTQIQQVIMNLVINARDAMPAGGTLRISAAAFDGSASSGTPATCRLTVSDMGHGIARETRSRIFDPFFTTKERGHGTGLGLSIVHGIVKEHGGRIEVASTPGQGTNMHVFLPLQSERDEVVTTAPPAPPRGNGALILLAEDNELIRKAIATTLRELSYEVLVASDASELMSCYQAHREHIDLLLFDVDLPGRSGLECLREIRHTAARTPALIITGDISGRGEFEAHELTSVLRKPFRMDTLARRVHQALCSHENEEARG